jgi:hypothetical protein
VTLGAGSLRLCSAEYPTTSTAHPAQAASRPNNTPEWSSR